MRRHLLLFVILFCYVQLSAQVVGIGYYDLDGLYDTREALFYNDSAYTPEGSKRWSEERYERKVKNTAAVIDSMALPIIGLFGLETDEVLRDIVRSSSLDYCSVHRTRNSFDGLDFALLYFGDQLFVERVEAQRDMLIIVASLADNSPFTIILTRNGDDTVDYLAHSSHEEMVVVMGMIYQNHINKLGYTNLLAQYESRSLGNYSIDRGYVMHDRIATNRKEKFLKSGVFITPWLLTPNHEAPLPTFDKNTYKGGYSKFLPIFSYICL
ncbi:MAG: hypothetical protein SNI45_01500 [Rikenellaceae bacterium]